MPEPNQAALVYEINRLSFGSERSLRKYSLIILVVLLAALPLFAHLNSLPIRIYDEARLAINAYEMSENGNLLVTYYEGEPDMWNTKPPLMIWCQVASIKIFGLNEVAIRLPSAIAGLLLLISLSYFSKKYLSSELLGLIMVLILLTAGGFIHEHVTRTGDYDSMLLLFISLSSLFFFLYIELQINKLLLFFFISLTLAVFTKGISGMLFFPGLMLYAIIRSRAAAILRQRHFWIYGIMFIAFVMGYYLLRENFNAGYIKQVWLNEIGGRFNTVVEEHDGGAFYYVNVLTDQLFKGWIVLIIPGAILGLLSNTAMIRKFALFSVILSSSFLIIISMAQTKLYWYAVPTLPFLSFLAALPIFFLIKYSEENIQLKIPNKILFRSALTFSIFLLPYLSLIGEVTSPREPEETAHHYPVARLLKQAVDGNVVLNKAYLVYEGYNPHLRFYEHMLNNKGFALAHLYAQDLAVGDTGIVFQDQQVRLIEQTMEYESLAHHLNAMLFKVTSKK